MLVKRIVNVLAAFGLFVCTQSYGSNLDLTGLSFDSVPCAYDWPTYKHHEGQQFTLKVIGQVTSDSSHAKVEFTQIRNGVSTVKMLEAPLTPQRPRYVPQRPYDPSKKLDDYVTELNTAGVKISQKFSWNDESEARLDDVSLAPPVLCFARQRLLKFHQWKEDVQQENNRTVITIPYGFEGEDPKSELEVMVIRHKEEPIVQSNIFFIDNLAQVLSVSVVTWTTVPEKFQKCAMLNKLTKSSQYQKMENGSKVALAVEATPDQLGKYYRRTDGEYSQQSPYIYADGNGGLFLTKLVRYWPKECTLDAADLKNPFPYVANADWVKIAFLYTTTYPIKLYDHAHLETPFPAGFFVKNSMSITQSGTSMSWIEFPPTPGTISLNADKKKPIFLSDWTKTLAELDDAHFKELMQCYKHFSAAPDPLHLPIKVEFSKLTDAQAFVASERLTQLIKAEPKITLDTDAMFYFICDSEESWQVKSQAHFDARDKNATLPWRVAGRYNTVERLIKGNVKLKKLDSLATPLPSRADLFTMLGALPSLEEVHVTSFKRAQLKDLSIDQLRQILPKLRGLDELELSDVSWGESAREATFAVSNNEHTLKHLDLSGSGLLGNAGSYLSMVVGDLRKLTHLNLLKSQFMNPHLETIFKGQASNDSLRILKTPMPYWPHLILEETCLTLRSWFSIRSVCDFVDAVGLTVMYPIRAPINGLFGHLGEQGVLYEEAIKYIACMKGLCILELELSGFRTYFDWTKDKIQELRKKNANWPISFISECK